MAVSDIIMEGLRQAKPRGGVNIAMPSEAEKARTRLLEKQIAVEEQNLKALQVAANKNLIKSQATDYAFSLGVDGADQRYIEYLKKNNMTDEAVKLEKQMAEIQSKNATKSKAQLDVDNLKTTMISDEFTSIMQGTPKQQLVKLEDFLRSNKAKTLLGEDGIAEFARATPEDRLGLIKQKALLSGMAKNAQDRAMADRRKWGKVEEVQERDGTITTYRYDPQNAEAERGGQWAGWLKVGEGAPQKPLVDLSEEKEETKHYFKTLDTYEKFERAAKSNEQALAFIEEQVGNMQTGSFEDLETFFQQAGAYFGMEFSELAAKEGAEAAMGAVVMNVLEKFSGAISEGEREFARNISPKMTQSKEGRQLIINFLRNSSRYDQDAATAYRAFYDEKDHGAAMEVIDKLHAAYVANAEVMTRRAKALGKGRTPAENHLMSFQGTDNWESAKAQYKAKFGKLPEGVK